MAIVQNPIIGQARNTSGGQIFSNWKGLKVMRSKPLNVANPRTPAQLAVRRRTALLASTMRAVLATIRFGFIRFQSGTTQWAQFLKSNYATATQDNGTIASLITTALKFAQGTIPGTPTFDKAGTAGQVITLEWVNNAGEGTAAATDELCLVIVNADGSAVWAELGAAPRSAETYDVTVPAYITASTAKVYGFFINLAADDVSDSQLAAG